MFKDKDFTLHIQVQEGHLRLIPLGYLTGSAVTRVLDAARSALTIFPALAVDLREIKEMEDNSLASLEEGLQQLISDIKLVLTSETPLVHWVKQLPPGCTCGGACRDCPHKRHEHEQVRKEG